MLSGCLFQVSLFSYCLSFWGFNSLIQNPVFTLFSRVFSSLLHKEGSTPGQSFVRHEAPQKDRGAHLAYGPRSLQEREETGGGPFSKQPEGAGQGEGARQQPQHHLLPETEEILKVFRNQDLPQGNRERIKALKRLEFFLIVRSFVWFFFFECFV